MPVEVRLVDGIVPIEAGLTSARTLESCTTVSHDGVGTMFFVTLEHALLMVRGRRYELPARSYAVLPDVADVRGERGIAVVVRSHRGLFAVGGPVEDTGRLRYIDGCSDTVLAAPVTRGDPCLNLLHLPRGVVQTDHEHPSVRVGLVLHGSGRCITPDGPDEDLVPGAAFVLPPHAVHRFESPDDEMLLVAWHPDSDTGPTDDDHPMLNRTLLPGGVERVQRALS